MQTFTTFTAGTTDTDGAPPAQVALAWIAQKAVSALIIGASKVHHFGDAIDALTWHTLDRK